MRVEVFLNDFNLSPALRRYVEARLWTAVDHLGGRMTWAGARFEPVLGAEGSPRVACQLDVWVRHAGLITVRQTDVDPFDAVDRATVRLRQAVARKISALAAGRGEEACPDWLAEHVWENEGGRTRRAIGPSQKPARPFSRRYRHDHREHSPRQTATREAAPARGARNRVSGFRSHPAELAHA
jgi:hypothetical protein